MKWSRVVLLRKKDKNWTLNTRPWVATALGSILNRGRGGVQALMYSLIEEHYPSSEPHHLILLYHKDTRHLPKLVSKHIHPRTRKLTHNNNNSKKGRCTTPSTGPSSAPRTNSCSLPLEANI